MESTFFLVFVEGDSVDEAFLNQQNKVSDHLFSYGAFTRNSSGSVTVTFVGFAIWHAKLILFVPKGYGKSLNTNKLENSEFAYLILQVFKKYARETYTTNPDARKLSRTLTDRSVSSFAIAIWLAEDFFKNGIYRNIKKKLSTSSNGLIDWSRTISQYTPHVSEASVTYLDYVAKVKVNDDFHFISRLHYSVLMICIHRYGRLLNLDLRLLEGEAVVPLEERVLFEFGQMHLTRELQHAYSDRSIHLLRNLQTFLEFNSQSSDTTFEIYGTQYFEKIWEDICSNVVGNDIKNWINNFPNPTWQSNTGEMAIAATLRPDIVREYISAGKKLVLLADAKYYLLNLPPKMSGNPGIADVIKQLVYELTIVEAANRLGITFSGNFFIFPKVNQPKLFSIDGFVTYPGIASSLIKVCFLDLTQAMYLYVSGQRLSDTEIASIFESTADT
jgi:hypothetical protein